MHGMILDIIYVLVGLGLLIVGAEGLVRGASSLARRLHISPLVIGLTIVSFGTSAPELTVNILSAVNGSSDLAVGNVVGSNIANILLILGITAIIVPLKVKAATVWKEIPLALLGAILLFIMINDRLLDGTVTDALTRTDGIALLSLMIIFMYYVFGMATRDRTARKELKSVGGEVHKFSPLISTGMIILGLVGLTGGGRLLVVGATGIAQAAGLSEALIGLTIVAVGTSLPELATSIIAALRKQADIAVGNIIGSNIFNIFFVLGTTSTILPLRPDGAVYIDMLIAVGATLLLFLFMFTGGKHILSRWQGVIFVSTYVAYIVFISIRG